MVALRFFQPLHQRAVVAAVMVDSMSQQSMVELVALAVEVATKAVQVVLVLLVKETMVALKVVAKMALAVVVVRAQLEQMALQAQRITLVGTAVSV
jgi:hypothetical protein